MFESTVEGFLVLALVVTPGFVFTSILTQLTRVPLVAKIAASESRFLLTMVVTGIIVHTIMFLWTINIASLYVQNRLFNHVVQVSLWLFVTLVIAPTILGFLVAWLMRWERIDKYLQPVNLGYTDRLASAWDYFMLQQKSCFIRIHLKDSRGIIGGVYSNKSFASIEDGYRDIFIEEVWKLDENGGFVEPVLATRGAWVSQEAMEYVEFLMSGDQYEQQAAAQAETSQQTSPEANSEANSEAAYGADFRAEQGRTTTR